jgi:S-(hydroxymethyl)mycothiol dehydrogenase
MHDESIRTVAKNCIFARSAHLGWGSGSVTRTRVSSASILTGPRSYEMTDIEFGPPSPGEVIVSMSAVGICHTDLHIANSRDGWGRNFPLLLGHEGAGIVSEVGSDVKHVRPGDRVAIGMRAPCGSCRQCHSGVPRRCSDSAPHRASLRIVGGPPLRPALGVGLFAESVPVDARAVVPIPANLPMSAAGILGCAISTGVGAVLNTAVLRPGQSSAIVGCGGVGISALQGTRIVHAYPRIAIDVSPRKLEWAVQLGATHVINSSLQDPVQEVMRITDGEGVDVAFEAVGKAECVESCIRMLSYGGTAIEIGVPSPGAVLEVQLAGSNGFFPRTSTLTVTHGGDSIPAQDIPTFLQLYAEGVLDLDGMITNEVDLAHVEEGFRNLEEGSCVRTVLRLGQAFS